LSGERRTALPSSSNCLSVRSPISWNQIRDLFDHQFRTLKAGLFTPQGSIEAGLGVFGQQQPTPPRDSFMETIASPMPYILAAIGGIFLSFLNLYEDSQKPKNQRVEKDLLWTIFFFFWPVAGAVLTFVYKISGYEIHGLLAFTLGLTAPTTLHALAQRKVAISGTPPNSEE
jgi:hypothetical protein